MIPLGTHNNNINLTRKENIRPRKEISYPNFSKEEFLARKKEFVNYKFFLYNLENSVKERIERGLKLLGAGQEAFFSNKCTHVITSKAIPIHDNLLQTNRGDTMTPLNTTNFKTDDPFIKNAIKWNLVLWSAEVMYKTVQYFVQSNSGSRKEPQENRALGKALQEEKMYGIATGANKDAQTKRPQFIPFTGHYLIVNDLSRIHRPPVVKQYTKEVLKHKQPEYPWPYLKTTAKGKSPFGKRPPNPNMKKDKHVIVTNPNDNNNKENIDPNKPILQPSQPPPQPPQLPKMNMLPALPTDSQNFSLRASGYQPYTNTTQVEMKRLPPTENVNRLDKRMVSQKRKQEVVSQEREEKKKKDTRFCENCNMTFEALEEHIKEKTHQTFVRDQNNFKQLDLILEKTHRVYKNPLPKHMKSLIDVNMDGKLNRSSLTDSSIETPPSSQYSPKSQKVEPQIAQNNEKGWNQYHDIFL